MMSEHLSKMQHVATMYQENGNKKLCRHMMICDCWLEHDLGLPVYYTN